MRADALAPFAGGHEGPLVFGAACDGFRGRTDLSTDCPLPVDCLSTDVTTEQSAEQSAEESVDASDALYVAPSVASS